MSKFADRRRERIERQERNLERAEKEEIEMERKGEGWSFAGIMWAFLMGLILASLGIFCKSILGHIAGVFGAIVFFAIGIMLLIWTKKRVKAWDKYDSIIRQRGNTELSFICEKTGKDMDLVCEELQVMINKKFLFGYIDRKYELLVITDKDTGMPLEPVDKYIKAKVEAKKKEQVEREKALNKSDELDILIDAIGNISDREVKIYIMSIAESEKRILKRIKEKPELKNVSSVNKLQTVYLPEVLKFVTLYQDEKCSLELRQKIEDALKLFTEAFQNTEQKLFEQGNFDTMIDLDIVESSLVNDGMLDRDFDVR